MKKEDLEQYSLHVPVLLDEVLNSLHIFENMAYLDCTLGYGGHFLAIYQKANQKGQFYGLDQDNSVIKYDIEHFIKADNIHLINTNYKDFKQVINQDIKFDAILMDLGINSNQIDEQERGFSYRFDARLDMRMNQNQKLDAYEVINYGSLKLLSQIFSEYGECKKAYLVAKKITEQRKIKPISTTFELRDLIYSIEFSYDLNRKNPAKQYFQALRIYVNDELNVLKNTIKQLANSLKPNGTLGIITFHSLEDKIVKNIFNELINIHQLPIEVPVIEEKAQFVLCNKKPILPTQEELSLNKRAHSAKLRILKHL